MLKFLVQEDLLKSTVKTFRRIPFAWRKAFCLALAVNFLVFFFDLAQFPLSDHDVGYQDGIPLLSGGRAGRWFTPFLHVLSGHVQIPVWTQILSFACQICAGMGAALLYYPKAQAWPLLAFALLVSLMPWITDFYYFHYMALAFTATQLFMVLALHFSLRASPARFYWRLSAVVLITCSLAAYQPAIMTFCTLFWGLFIQRLIQWGNGKYGAMNARQVLGAILRELFPPLLCLLLACLLYALSPRLYPLVGLSLGLYQFQTVEMASFLPRIGEVFGQAYLRLITPDGFFSAWLCVLLLLVVILGLSCLFGQGLKRHKSLQPLCLLVALAFFPLAAFAQFLVSASTFYSCYRFLPFGLSYLYAFFLLQLLESGKILFRNLGLILAILIFPAQAINCLDQQISHVRQVEHDRAVLNRVMARIEALPEFDAKKTWNLVQIGRTIPYLENIAQGSSLNNNTISQSWHPGFELRLLGKYLKLGTRINEEVRERPDLMRKALAWARGRKPFPARDSVAIIDDTIVLYFDSKAIASAEKRLEDLAENAEKTASQKLQETGRIVLP